MSEFWFYDSVEANEVNLVREMVRSGKWDLYKPLASVRKEIRRGMYPIHLACYSGHYDMAIYMVAEGVSVNVRTDYAQRTPLHYCCMDKPEHSDLACATMLLRNGADIDVRDRWGNTPCHYSADAFTGDVIRYLIRHSASLEVRDMNFRTPLMRAVRNSRVDATRALLEASCDGNSQDLEGNTAVHMAARLGQPDVILRMLIETGCDVNIFSRIGRSPLMEGVQYGNRNAVTMLLKSVDDKNQHSPEDGQTALHLAVECKRRSMIELLLERGCRQDVYDFRGRSPLYGLMLEKNSELFRYCLQLGMDLDIPVLKTADNTLTAAMAAMAKNSWVIFNMIKAVNCEYIGCTTYSTYVNNADGQAMTISPAQTPSLKHICRKKIRKTVGLFPNSKLPQLTDLPKPLINFLMLIIMH